jgi:argininosuccinate lyase|tara:strand:- start:362 stop:1546 length:1185 start_codon:yes stop_codon:yes gene_type:complete
MKKLWDKGYDLNKTIESYTVGNDPILDKQLIYYDCIASIAHTKMLGKMGLLTKTEAMYLVQELKHIIDLDKKGEFPITQDQEDCHTAIEMFLTNSLGDVGKKIHTARSRNDQVLTALRLYYKDQINNINQLIEGLIYSISSFTSDHGNIQFPGYTHMQRAMPSSFDLWGTAFLDSMKDNLLLLDTVNKLVDQSPLGTAAGYGVPLNIDREFTAKELGFSSVQNNSVYTQFSRGKFEISVLHVLSQIMLDLNKIASDLILISMSEFGYVEIPDEFCTGSSIMPQKKNPDVLELLRAKYHVVSSFEFQVTQLTANLISGYNRDIQLTKEPVMRGFSITAESIKIAILLFQNISVNEQKCKDAMTDELFATEKVYELVKKGVPFRDAYLKIAKTINK